MSAFEVYLLMTIAGIHDTASIFAWLFVFGTAAVALAMIFIPSGEEPERHLWIRRVKKSLVITSILAAVTVIVPSQKTIALIYVLPEITNPELVDAISDEGKEFYGLAKEALKKMAEGD